MSDTKALIKYVSDRLNEGPNITFGKPTVFDLVEALESAEAIAKDNSEALTAAYMSGKYDGRKEAEANVARLAKMVDFMAQQMADVYSTDEDGRYVLTCPVRTLRAADHDCDKISCPQCWNEAARKSVEGK